MAKKTKSPKELGLSCKDCRHSYDPHSKALDGHMILCRCKFDAKTEHGKWCKFLKDPQCEHFMLKR